MYEIEGCLAKKTTIISTTFVLLTKMVVYLPVKGMRGCMGCTLVGRWAEGCGILGLGRENGI